MDFLYFVVQRLDVWRCCGFVVDLLYSFRLVVGLLQILLYVQLVVQQIHNKSNKWSLSVYRSTDSAYQSPCRSHEVRHEAFEMKGLRKIPRVSWTAKKTNEWLLNKAGVNRELLDTDKARKLAY